MLRAYAVPSVREAEDQVRAGLAEGELMMRAATGLARVVRSRVLERGARRIVVLAGPGDNGGDALHAAALLTDVDPDGASPDLDITVLGLAERLHPAGLAAVTAAGIPVHHVTGGEQEGEASQGAARALEGADIVIDGLLGIGGRPGLRDPMAQVVAAVPESAYLISVDLPSGADPEGLVPPGPTGEGPACVRADETVTFGMLKPVHLLPATEPNVGRLTLVDIGVAMEVPPTVERLEPADVSASWPVPGPQDHKYTRGVLGVVAGSDDYPGAAVLCVTAAVAAGAGMVRYEGPRRAEDLVLAACPEAVPGQGQVQAQVVGPGAPAEAAVRAALARDVPTVVDAGALDVLAEIVAGGSPRTAPTLLTPHAGELARLLTALEKEPTDREQVETDLVGTARRAARLTGCTVLLKGSTTLVVEPDPAVPVRAQTGAPAWLATAGAGDVLAGLCGVLLAAGLDPREAGSLAALVHGAAAHTANPGGPVRALAVAHALPRTIAQLLALA